MEHDKRASNIKVSVVIPNNGRDISRIRQFLCLAKNIEIVEIDLGKERSYQRNVGIKKAKGEYILILDSDQAAPENLLIECVYLMKKNENCGGIYIPEIIVGQDWFTKLRNFERQFYTGTAIDCVRFVRNPCPLFDETMTGPEDADWDLRIKGDKLISSHVLYHHDNINLFDYIRKKNYYAKSMKQFAKKHPKAKVLNLKYRCWTVFTEKGKWKKLLKHPVMTMGLIGLLALRGVIYLKK